MPTTHPPENRNFKNDSAGSETGLCSMKLPANKLTNKLMSSHSVTQPKTNATAWSPIPPGRLRRNCRNRSPRRGVVLVSATGLDDKFPPPAADL